MADKENVKVVCPVCKIEFLTAIDSNKTKCPNCDFEFELEPSKGDKDERSD